jgi:plasmid stabilization system protein ParE
MTLRFTPRARNDLRDILEYIAKENPLPLTGYVRRSWMPSNSSARDLIWGFATRKNPELRSHLVTRYPYRIHYRVEDADILIVHIRHSARRPWNGET